MKNARSRRDTARVIDLAPVDKFRQLVALIADGIVVVDSDGKVRLVNPAAEELLGRRGRDLIGQYFGFPVGGDATEIEIVRPDGKAIVVELRAAEIEWDEGPAAVASLRDVTERALLADQQNQMIDRLKELDRLKTEFVSIVSHDLRSPMATITGFADTLRFNWDAFDDEHKKEMLERIGTSSAQLARFVENVLQVNQIESGNLNYDIKEMDVADVVYRVATENRQPVHRQRASHEIVVTVPEGLPLALGDDIRQWQILTNLVTNAMKFSPPDSTIEIDVTTTPTHIQIAVTDQGIGIKPEDRSKLFQKFSRLPARDGVRTKGTGLGLYICRSMVEAQGGTIGVDSEPGRGSTFSYTVPIAS